MAPAKKQWFDKCARAPWQPPPIVFKIVWPILYILYAITIYLVRHDKTSRNLLLVGLVMNLCWVPLFVANTQFALLLLTCMIAVAVECVIILNKGDMKNGRTGLGQHAAIFSPYLAWICFAWTLNAYLAVTCH